MSQSRLILPTLNFQQKHLQISTKTLVKTTCSCSCNCKNKIQFINSKQENLFRRYLLAQTILTPFLLSSPSFASQFHPANSPSLDMINDIRPQRADWYEELFAWVMNKCMNGYESGIAKYKTDLFRELKEKQVKEILEIGIGTGPNLKYYARDSGVHVIGVDPNKKMEKYAKEAADAAGLKPANFDFVHAVGEILPVNDESVDAVVGTLVLCSVTDVDRTLQEVKRVLKPGGIYVFIEHVAAQDGTFLRFAQNILNPLQQAVGDNCHLTRETGKYISGAGFSQVTTNTASIPKAFVVNPQVYGIARK